ncbi:hypothetical protein CRUP_007577, partial [Coryphaenoides rupestris]
MTHGKESKGGTFRIISQNATYLSQACAAHWTMQGQFLVSKSRKELMWTPSSLRKVTNLAGSQLKTDTD